MISLKVNGIEAVQKKLAQIPKAMPQAMNATVLYVHSKIPPYPPAPATSTYRRTGTMGRSITAMQSRNPDALSRVDQEGSRVRGIVGTRIKYAPFVIDKMRQASFHKANGWYNLQDVIAGLHNEILRVYREALIKFTLR